MNEEYKCVKNQEILRNFKNAIRGTIKIMKRDVGDFNKSDWFIQYTSIYGLMKRRYIIKLVLFIAYIKFSTINCQCSTYLPIRHFKF